MRLVLAVLLAPLAFGCADTSSGDSLDAQQNELGWGPDACPATPPGRVQGFDVGNQLGDLELHDCAGEPVNLTALCGADALWLSLAHMWCPHCVEAAADMERIHQSYIDAGRELATLSIVVEAASGDRPDEGDCSAWRDQHGQDRVITLYDDDTDSFVLWDENFTNLNVVMDRDRVIHAKIHTPIEADIREAIDIVLP